LDAAVLKVALKSILGKNTQPITDGGTGHPPRR
jgi:hypothetical protein